MPVVAIIMFIGMFCLNIVQLMAIQDGLQEWWGIPGWLAFGVGFLGLVYGGPIIGLLFGIVGFFAAMNVWDWAWWQAALLCFPAVIFAVTLTMLDGVFSIGSAMRRRRL